MSLYQQWKDIAYQERTQEEYDKFWGEYFPAEQTVYIDLLTNHQTVYEDTVANLAKKFDFDNMTFVGFLDGINTSLVNELTLDELTEDSVIKLEIDFETLYYNMHAAQAEWLYTLEEWAPILSEEKRLELKKDYNRSKTVVKEEKVRRNDPCPCGSGKKYKKCCMNK